MRFFCAYLRAAAAYLPAVALLVLGATMAAVAIPTWPSRDWRRELLTLLSIATMYMTSWVSTIVRDKELLKLRVKELEEANASLEEENTALLKSQMEALASDEAASLPQHRYHAHFEPEAWVDDDAVDVDPLGPCGWDCTPFVHAHDLAERIDTACDSILGRWLDTQDLLKDDPAAPEWVRDWDGPFTITVERV